MTSNSLKLMLALTVAALACGNQIGDSCSRSQDCSQEGTRICDLAQEGGYCTIPGCDSTSCPDEAVCVRFFPVSQLSRSCTDDTGCTVDEICTLSGLCASRSTEQRYCMLKCSDHGDCRQHYECRDEERMKAHGGQPAPNDDGSERNPIPFCASAKSCMENTDCDFDPVCDIENMFCIAGS